MAHVPLLCLRPIFVAAKAHFDPLIDNTPSGSPSGSSFALSLSQTLVGLCRLCEDARRKHPWGSRCSPVPECLRGNLFRSGKGKMEWFESQFCFSLLGQNYLVRRENMDEARSPLFPSFGFDILLIDDIEFIVKSVPVYELYSVVSKQR